MCGIAGLIPAVAHREVDGARLDRLSTLLRHRGPDDVGYLLSRDGEIVTGRRPERTVQRAELVLLHRRLSIIDLSSDGWQPMSTGDGRHHIVFNGEVYNYVELRRELQQQGYRFRSQSDTEVLLAAYACWGLDSLPRLKGMFAFGIFDVRRRELVLARDPFGIKPLYYARVRGGFAFASEIAPLLELDGVGRGVAPQPLYDYLIHGRTDAGSDTLFESVKELRPAHYAVVPLDDPGTMRPECYWTLEATEDRSGDVGEAAEELRSRFLDNIRLHMRSDVPLGAALSGGVDSSAIVASMRHLNGSGLDLQTFSYIADDPSLSEERWVDIVGAATGACTHKVRPAARDLVDDLPRLLRTQELPFVSMSIYVQYRVFGLARDAGIRVMLDGQGADEMLAGYSYFAAVRLASLIRCGRLLGAARFFRGASRGVGRNPGWLASRAGQFLVPSVIERPLRSLARAEREPSWLNVDWFEARSAGPREEAATHKELSLRRVMTEQLTGAGLGALLRFEDRNSMAHSIESRVPFLTTDLAEFLASLPDHYLMSRDGVSKAVFRRAMRGIVPDAVLDRRDKIGFRPPEEEWIRELGSWTDEVLGSDRARSVPALNSAALEEEWRAVRDGRAGFRRHVWRWVNLLEWARQFDVSFD